MPQFHLYVPDSVAERVRARAQARQMPVSRYLAEVVRREVGESWPAGWFESVVGAWQGEPLERARQGGLEQREAFRGPQETTSPPSA